MDMTNPNDLQRSAADPSVSAWVAASAGSGKTKVLSDRVLNLLLNGTPPEKILCLTFTRTAAAQMANRIADRLAKWATHSDEELAKELTDLTNKEPTAKTLSKARRLFARLLDTPGGLKVTTLHGFAQSLLKRFPIEAGVSPQFEVMDEREARDLIEQAQDSVLGRPEFETALSEIVLATTEDGFSDALKEMTASLPRLKSLQIKYPTTDILKRAYEAALGLSENVTAEALIREFCAAIPEQEIKSAINILVQSSKVTDQKTAEKLSSFIILSDSEKNTRIWDYLSAFLTQSGTIRKSLATKDSSSALLILMPEAERAETLAKKIQSEQIMRISLALMQIGMAMMEKYTALKATRSVMDYDDLISATRNLLEKSGASAWVLYKLDGGIDHILVDEAQDTSPAQWAIIRALAEEFFSGQTARTAHRTLFAVGDKKQSIFSFQGADPEEFEKMRLFFKEKVLQAGKKWNDVPMYISFRSVPAVIDSVNFVLRHPPAIEGVLSEDEDATHISWRKNQAGLVEIWPPEKPQEDDTEKAYTKPVERVFSQTPSARLARKIAERISLMIQNERLESENRPIRAGDILILVRRRNSFIEELSRELKTRGVPVSGVDRLKIAMHIAVMDLMVLGDFLLLPEDDLALATVLRSPLCGISAEDLSDEDIKRAQEQGVELNGISEQDLFTLAHNRGKQSLFERLRSYKNSPETPPGRAYLFLHDLLSRVDNMRPYELYSYVLGTLGKQKEIITRLGVQALDALDEFMSLALNYDSVYAPSLQNFLKWVRHNDIEIKRDPEQSSFDAVRIMTVHAAKGLQAPVVFLPDTRQHRFFPPKYLWTEENDLPLWSPKKDYRDEHVTKGLETAKDKDRREYNRLLYVALTRAADRLYICGWDTKQGGAEGNWYDLVRDSMTAAEEIKTPLFDEPILQWASKQRTDVTPKTEIKSEKTTPPLPVWAVTPPPEEPAPPRPLAPSRPDTEEPSLLSPLSLERLQAMKRGTLIHRLLEMLPKYSSEKQKAAAEKIIARSAPDLPETEKAEIIAKLLGIISNPDFSSLFSSASLAEVPVSGIVNNRIITGQIDRMAVLKDDVLIVDYKSNRKIPASPKETPKAYIRQMSAYASLLREIYPEKTVRCLLLWTEAPLLTDITPFIR